ncbi:TldD/PmbA family protein [Chloroflexota bacterium]
MEHILEGAKRICDEAEVFLVSHRETEVIFEADRLKQIKSTQSSGAALRLVVDGRIGFAAARRPDGGSEELIAMALETAPFGAEAKFQFPGPQPYPQVDVYNPEVEVTSEGEMVELGQALIDRVKSNTPDVLCEASVVKGTAEIEVINSRGGTARYKKSVFGLSLEGILIRGTDMLFVGDSQSSCHPISDPSEVAEVTIEQLERARESAVPPTGRLPVVFTPRGVASALIIPLGMAFNGKTVLQGASPLGGRRGERVFDPRLSVWDDPQLAFRPGSRPCDDEGVPSRRTALVEDGVVAGFLYDLQTAALAGETSTGNGSRGLGSLPSPSASTVSVGVGDATFEEMIADIKKGLVVEMLMGASQGNLLGGEFSGNVLLGYLVENGRLVGRVKDTMVSGNVYEVLGEVAAIGREAKWVGGSLLVPDIYCPGLSVAVKV